MDDPLSMVQIEPKTEEKESPSSEEAEFNELLGTDSITAKIDAGQMTLLEIGEWSAAHEVSFLETVRLMKRSLDAPAKKDSTPNP
jgi:hypothetical protein